MNDSMHKLIFFGNERLGTGLSTSVPVLQAVLAAGYQVTAVVVAQNEVGKSRSGRTLEIVQVAAAHNIPVLSPAKLAEAKDELEAFEAEAAVLVAYGKIVPQNIIDIFPRGIVNIHPSLLPKHRGPTPIESVILNSERETGVSLMKLGAKMDAGPVYAQTTVQLSGNETKQALAEQLIIIGKDMLLQHLPEILDGSLQPQSQDDNLATYDGLFEKADGILDFHETASQLERKVRAFAGWPRSRANIGTTEVIITQAHVIDVNGVAGTLWLGDRQIGVHASEGVLVIDRLIPAGKKEMDASAFLSGYKPN